LERLREQLQRTEQQQQPQPQQVQQQAQARYQLRLAPTDARASSLRPLVEQEVQPVQQSVRVQCLARVACEGSHGGLSYLDPPQQLLSPSLMRAQQMEESSRQEQPHQVERISPDHDLLLSLVCSALRKMLHFLGEPPPQSPAQMSKDRR
jgi:hypothetical protein